MNSNQVDFSTFCIGSVARALGMNQAEAYRRLKSSEICITSQTVIDKYLRFIQFVNL